MASSPFIFFCGGFTAASLLQANAMRHDVFGLDLAMYDASCVDRCALFCRLTFFQLPQPHRPQLRALGL
jgi:hypothetical protein